MAEAFLTELWGMAKQAGPFVTLFMFYLWFKDSKRVEKLQEERDILLEKVRNERDQLLERILTAINNNTNSLRDIADLFKNRE